VDRQTLMVRRAIAAAAAFLVLILLIFGIKGCFDQRKERAFKDYVQDVDALVRESDQGGKGLFGLLSARGGRNEAVDIENRLNQFRVQSAQLVDRARDTDHPDELNESHDFLVETLEFRRDGLAQVADSLPTALGDQDRRQGTDAITREMQSFLASDVVYYRRFVPSLKSALDGEDLGGEVRIPRSQFLPDIEWLDPRFVAGRVSGIRTGRGGGADGDAAPGLHGSGLGTVSLGGQALSPGGAATVKLSGDLKFQVQVANQGEHTETDVIVRARIGRGDDAVEVEGDAPSIAAGETKTVEMPLEDQPPPGQNVPIEIEVEPVPGEEKTDNNKQTFSAIFTR
jgi:hypothetical protein